MSPLPTTRTKTQRPQRRAQSERKTRYRYRTQSPAGNQQNIHRPGEYSIGRLNAGNPSGYAKQIIHTEPEDWLRSSGNTPSTSQRKPRYFRIFLKKSCEIDTYSSACKSTPTTLYKRTLVHKNRMPLTHKSTLSCLPRKNFSPVAGIRHDAEIITSRISSERQRRRRFG